MKIFLLIPREFLVSPGKNSRSSGKRTKTAKSMSLYFCNNSNNYQKETYLTGNAIDFRSALKIAGSITYNVPAANSLNPDSNNNGTAQNMQHFKPFQEGQSRVSCS